MIDLVQWPAMVVTLLASWLVASTQESRRKAGFWVFLLSNVLWVVWGVGASAYALIALQVGLATLNVRGAIKARREERRRDEASSPSKNAPGSTSASG